MIDTVINKITEFFFFLNPILLGCDGEKLYVSDSYCDDGTNNAQCQYDGGDCCGPNVNTYYCTLCVCHENCQASLELLGNGFCNDEANNADCDFDGGDCCKACIHTQYCLDCLCYEGLTSTNRPVCDNCPMEWIYLIGVGYCVDPTNTANCNFGNGDCCEPNVDTSVCIECVCYEDLVCDAPLELIGNGICNDESNHGECNFDGGDCCGNHVDTTQCSECHCYEGSPFNYFCKSPSSKQCVWVNLSKHVLHYFSITR